MSVPDPRPGARDLDVKLLRFRSQRHMQDAAPLARDLLDANRLPEAVEVIQAALGGQPNNAALRVLEGRTWLMQGDYLRAQAALLQAARLAPGDKDAFRWLGEVLLKRGDPQRALGILARCRQIDPHDRQVEALQRRAERLAKIVATNHSPKAPTDPSKPPTTDVSPARPPQAPATPAAAPVPSTPRRAAAAPQKPRPPMVGRHTVSYSSPPESPAPPPSAPPMPRGHSRTDRPHAAQPPRAGGGTVSARSLRPKSPRSAPVAPGATLRRPLPRPRIPAPQPARAPQAATSKPAAMPKAPQLKPSPPRRRASGAPAISRPQDLKPSGPPNPAAVHLASVQSAMLPKAPGSPPAPGQVGATPPADLPAAKAASDSFVPPPEITGRSPQRRSRRGSSVPPASLPPGVGGPG
ncbi:MAG: tetratricopeptide repeat protein, partial [Polyangiales bacterium]